MMPQPNDSIYVTVLKYNNSNSILKQQKFIGIYYNDIIYMVLYI